MNQPNDTLVCFAIEELRFAIPINEIKTIIRSVAITPVSGAWHLIHGMINFRGKVIPVVTLRPRFNLPEKEINIHQQFIIVGKAAKRLALIVDTVEELIAPDALKVSTVELPHTGSQQQNIHDYGIDTMQFVSDEKGIIVIYDIQKLIGAEGILEIESFINRKTD